jgi:polyisoprenoid-binding protein YceI
MARWTFEPGHTAAEFSARHMMVTCVRGCFKDVHGALIFDADDPGASSVEAIIDARKLWSGEPERDAHLRSPDFLDVEQHPYITFKSNRVELVGGNDYRAAGFLTIRGVTREVVLEVRYLGQWTTPWWEDGVDRGPKIRAGFVGKTKIDRHDFGVSWNAMLDKGGLVVGTTIEITIDAEAILQEETVPEPPAAVG